MFNLNKSAQKAVTTTEKMLIDNNEELGLKPNEKDGTYNALLSSDRDAPVGDKIIEKALDGKSLGRDARTGGSDDKAILEGALNSIKGTMNKLRDESTDVPLMDFSRESELALSEDYQKAVDKEGGDTSFWDKYVGDQLPADMITKITNNVQPSQLVENYETREDFDKQNPPIGKKVPGAEDNIMGKDLEPEQVVVYKNKSASVQDLMRDADAMLYHVYRTAAEDSRELTDKEQQMVTDINSAKIRVLSQAKSPDQLTPEEWDEILRSERSQIEGDDEAMMQTERAIAGLSDTLRDEQRDSDAEQELEWDDPRAAQGTGREVPEDTPSLDPPWFEQR